MTNTLYFGDNLHVLRDHIASESVDLVYLDPPFNSNANYNILFKSPEGAQSESQIEAFEDTWHWNDSAEDAFDEVMRSGNTDAFTLLRAMRDFLGENDMMAYLAMMAVRLIELHRVLKPTGSLYLHCDPTASHYLKLLLDGVFGATNYRNEIVWKRKAGRGETNNAAIRFGVSHDIVLFYAKSPASAFVRQYRPNSQDYINSKFTHVDESGRRYRLDNLTSPSFRPNLVYEYKGYQPPEKGWAVSLERMKEMDAEGRVHFPDSKEKRLQRKRFLDELEGETVDTLWDDISPINSQAQERLGYPTQKPLALLERIIAASSNEGDVVLDPFCGCGTAVHAAQKLGRQWIGIDVTHLAVGLIEKRMKEAFPALDFEVKGRPQSLASAQDLAKRDKHQFELWALSVVDADPWKGGRKGPDGGIDGIIWFKPDGKKTEKAIVEVKGGATGVKDVGRLAQVMEREGAKIGVLITNQLPTRAMERDAAAVGVWENEYTGRKHPRLQIITLAELFQNKRPDIPWVDTSVAKKARREETSKQAKLL
ncbi:site-specific DNA-methyltransferase [Erythrobacter aureus]|uniref:site-specific DNA-methyltransferase (adenine-specific) n=1 Tax=Erythrobacter aureus TaxID=2182384 RepID=A0A345YBC7_9SPHN|nr:DNA methyltransferase [Erythrobacter aureus]AXK41229.1 site-specific DNA-methyltransferase [Erythrobacter aureus]